MNYIETEIFGNVSLPKSLNEIIDLISIHAQDRRNVYLWRGQGNINWGIHSAAFRRLQRSHNPVSEKDMKSYEKHLLKHATHQGYRFYEGRLLSDFELLAKLQHHGAATRLIDCSRNLLTALWFACSSENNETGILFGVHSDSLGGGENKPEDRSYDDIFKGIEKYQHPQTWQPPIVTKRIAAQGAQFLYSTVSINKIGSLAIPDDNDSYIAIGITKELKTKLMEELSETFDIRYLTLFPDIDGFGHANSFRFHEYESERW